LTAPKPSQDFVPYIYSRAELQRLLDDPSQCQRPSACRITAVTFRALLLVLYGTGMRLGEALRLRVADVDLAQNLIRIREAKFYKTRLVPIVTMSISSLRTTFHLQTEKRGPTLLRSNQKRATESRRPLQNELLGDWGTRAGSVAPTLFPFSLASMIRHTFAVHRVTAWYRQGADVQKLLPALSAYLGHVSLESTQRYLTMTPELLQQANNRFERYAKGGAQ
jgi:site-specific recombinase XerD